MRTATLLNPRLVYSAPLIAALMVSATADNPFVPVENTGALFDDPVDFGVSWGDFDQDGNVDVFSMSSYWLREGGRRLNWLHRNNGSGLFSRVSPALIGDLATDDGDGALGVWGDIDNDGDLDLYVANVTEGNRFNSSTPPASDYLYVNDGTGYFTRHTTAPFTTEPRRSGCASLVDYDRDGLLDVFIGAKLPGSGSVSVLYHNNGSLHFTPVFTLTGQLNPDFGAWADFDGDGDLDLVTGDLNANRSSYLYVNESSSDQRDAFTVLSAFPDGTPLPRQAYSADWGDVDNDGDLDLLMPEVFKTGCDLFVNSGEGHFERILIPMQDAEKPASVCWVDADNDGDLDFIVGGHSTAEQERLSYFENQGALSFQEYVIAVPGKFNGGAALADWDNDGFTDFHVNAFEIANYCAHNVGNDNHWLKLVLKGTVSNASAVGTMVRLKATIAGTQTWQMRHVRAGSETPLVQHDPRPNFGLGDASVAEVVRIEWPSGTVQELTNVPANQILTVVEPPRLKVESGSQLSWPVTADGYRLESSTSIDGFWSEATETVETDAGRKSITIQTDGKAKFYRLNGQ